MIKITDDLVGKVFESNNYGKFEVLELDHKDNNYNKYYKVKFIETNYEVIAIRKDIKKGNIRDKFCTSVYGIGCLGNVKKVKNKRLYKIWNKMLGKCYSKKDNKYKSYGKKGVVVCDRWKCYEKFRKDVKDLKGWNETKFNKGEIELDKDTKIKNNMIYSKETCIWLNSEENRKYQPSHQNKFKAISPKGKIFYHYNQSEFARKHDLNRGNINSTLHNKQKHHKGWKFEFIKEDN